MPLKKGQSKEVIHENIKEMIAAGHDAKSAVAAAYHTAKMSEGGEVMDMEHPEDIPGPLEHDEDTNMVLEALKKKRRY